MCELCYRQDIPKLPHELITLRNRGVIQAWDDNPQLGWRVKQDEWTGYMTSMEMREWLDTELVTR